MFFFQSAPLSQLLLILPIASAYLRVIQSLLVFLCICSENTADSRLTFANSFVTILFAVYACFSLSAFNDSASLKHCFLMIFSAWFAWYCLSPISFFYHATFWLSLLKNPLNLWSLVQYHFINLMWCFLIDFAVRFASFFSLTNIFLMGTSCLV